MFREVFGFELRQQLRSPLFWLVALALAAVAFGAASSDSIRIGGGIGNVYRNAPIVVVTMLAMFSVIGLFLITIFVASAALRDFASNTAEMVLATPMSRRAYLGGRFAAGYAVSALVLVAVAFGLWLGSLMPWLDPARLGPTPWAAYAFGLGVLALPNLFFIAALVFLLATLTRSMLGAYVGVIAFFILWTVTGLALGGGNIEHQTAAALADPFGLRTLDLVTRYWTASDQNARMPRLAGVLLGNRALWLSTGAALVAATLAWFKPERRPLRWVRRRRRVAAPAATGIAPVPVVLPVVTLRTGWVARWIQFRKLAWFDTVSVLRGTAFLVMVVLGLLNLTGNLAFIGEMYGTPVFPVTHLVAQAMDQSYQFLLLIVLAFYAGELVWRERGAKVSEVVDAFPTPDWLPLASKVFALAVVIAVFTAAGSLYGMGYQLLHGFTHLQPLLYLKFMGFVLLDFGLFAILAVVLQAWANNKFVGYALIVAYLVALIAFGQLHWSDNLYLLDQTPNAPYSDMDGFDAFWVGKLWFGAYWYALSIALLVTAALYWARGNVAGWRARGRIALQRFRRPARALLAASLAAFAGIGVFIWHNTHGLYRYQTYDEGLRLQANYEKDYRKYLGVAQPRIADVDVDMAIHPHHRAVDITGRYTLVNRHARPIDTLLVQLPTPGIESREYAVKLDFPAHAVKIADAAQGFYLYRLAAPLAPGASMPFTFHEHVAFPGFANAATGKELVHNGTFINSQALPHFCYDPDRELKDANDRRKYGLGPVHLLPKRGDVAARGDNLISCDADWVHFQATVSTTPNQIALAPGYLQKEWTANGRRYFHYVQDSPILDFFSFQSARWQVARSQWRGVNLEVYYDRSNAWNVHRILKAMQFSLGYYAQNFGPYQFRQLRILEFPGFQGGFAQSFANTVPFSEGFVLQDLRKPDDIDYITYVTAHETAHQWWGHQAIGANVQGVTMLDESLAQYSALMVMKHLYGPTKMRKFLKYELDRYLAGRGTEKVAEQPLATVENQPYIHYRKASVIFYALQDYIGEDKVNAALRTWLDKVKFQQPPYTTTQALIADLRAEAGPQYQNLITDFFDKITLFDDRMVKATAKKLPDGRYAVTMHVHAAKYYADGKGKETRARVDIPIEIGVFAKAKDGEEQDEKPLYLAKYPVKDGDSVITVAVDGVPYEAGIDPFNELVDRVSNDNRASVTVQ